MFSTWDAVEQAVVLVVETSSQPFDGDTVANTRDVLAVCRLNCSFPIEVAKGYWSTISLSWTNFELAVFGDRVEIYRFYDKRTDIREESHVPGHPFSLRFLSELPKLAS